MRWAMLLLLLGCGDNTAGAGDPFELRSGGRLRLRHWVYEDGTRQWDPSSLVFDAKLGVDCAVQRWSDGHLYCTPAANAVVYGDAACEKAFGYAPKGSPVPAFFKREFVLASETLPSRLYQRRSDPVFLSQFWQFSKNECIGPFDNEDAHVFEVSEADVARIKTTAPLGDDRLRLTMQTSDDGLQTPMQLHDSFVDQPCELAVVGGAPACVPPAAPATYFRDAACTTPVVAFSHSHQRTNVATITGADGCPSYFVIGQEESKYPLHEIVDGACVPIELPDSDIVFGLAQPFELAKLEPRVRSSARLEATELVDGALHLPSPTLFDTQLATDCNHAFPNNTARCLPLAQAAVVETYYADNPCSTRARVARVHTGSCVAPTRFAAGFIEADLNFFEIGEPVTDTVYSFASGQCEPVELDGSRFHNLGVSVPITAFAAAALVRD